MIQGYEWLDFVLIPAFFVAALGVMLIGVILVGNAYEGMRSLYRRWKRSRMFRLYVSHNNGITALVLSRDYEAAEKEMHRRGECHGWLIPRCYIRDVMTFSCAEGKDSRCLTGTDEQMHTLTKGCVVQHRSFVVPFTSVLGGDTLEEHFKNFRVVPLEEAWRRVHGKKPMPSELFSDPHGGIIHYGYHGNRLN